MADKDSDKDSEKDGIEKLKVFYSELQKKYSLPEFEKLNEDFHIEKIAEEETELLLSEVRRYMSEKFSNYLRFIESVLNPVNSPMLIFSILKNLSSEEKEKLSDIYKKLAKLEIKILELDLQFDEEKEVNFIKTSFDSWQEIKKVLLEVMKNVEKNWDVKVESSKKDYFG